MSENSATSLLERARKGNIAAFGELLGLYQKCLSILAALQVDRRLQGKGSPSDIVQETFLRAHRYFPQFAGQTDAEFAAWLRSILATVIANHIRTYLGTRQRDARLEQSLTIQLDNASSVMARTLMAAGGTPSEIVVKAESVDLLSDAINRLPDDYRTTILLRDFQGLTFNEIADEMGRSVDSVQKLWIRALTQLRRSLRANQTL